MQINSQRYGPKQGAIFSRAQLVRLLRKTGIMRAVCRRSEPCGGALFSKSFTGVASATTLDKILSLVALELGFAGWLMIAFGAPGSGSQIHDP